MINVLKIVQAFLKNYKNQYLSCFWMHNFMQNPTMITEIWSLKCFETDGNFVPVIRFSALSLERVKINSVNPSLIVDEILMLNPHRFFSSFLWHRINHVSTVLTVVYCIFSSQPILNVITACKWSNAPLGTYTNRHLHTCMGKCMSVVMTSFFWRFSCLLLTSRSNLGWKCGKRREVLPQ